MKKSNNNRPFNFQIQFSLYFKASLLAKYLLWISSSFKLTELFPVTTLDLKENLTIPKVLSGFHLKFTLRSQGPVSVSGVAKYTNRVLRTYPLAFGCRVAIKLQENPGNLNTDGKRKLFKLAGFRVIEVDWNIFIFHVKTDSVQIVY